MKRNENKDLVDPYKRLIDIQTKVLHTARIDSEEEWWLIWQVYCDATSYITDEERTLLGWYLTAYEQNKKNISAIAETKNRNTISRFKVKRLNRWRDAFHSFVKETLLKIEGVVLMGFRYWGIR